ncbi:hypothetical protein OGATHE_002863 [Ogataea polymorpha]|uniref:Uncharacterized protein n=1 Tax=Ogataea polymorpha TaxID=460523 RepID=A0A9P8PE79_9ASCO|nr:hypothetical protein OGATHE_002863 [Ogataea polymorpha]
MFGLPSKECMELSGNVSLVVYIHDRRACDRVQVRIDSVCPHNRTGPHHDIHGSTSIDAFEVFVVSLQFVVLLGLESGFDDLCNQLSQNRMFCLGLECPLLKLDSSGHVVLPVLHVDVLLDGNHKSHISIRVKPRVDWLLQVCVDVCVDTAIQKNQQVSSEVGTDDFVWQHLERLEHLRNGVFEPDSQNLQDLVVSQQVIFVGWVLVFPLVHELLVREVWVGGRHLPHLPNALLNSSGAIVIWKELGQSLCSDCCIVGVGTPEFWI